VDLLLLGLHYLTWLHKWRENGIFGVNTEGKRSFEEEGGVSIFNAMENLRKGPKMIIC